MQPELAGRGAVASAARVVVKVGSSSLTTTDGELDDLRIRALADALAARRLAGCDVVLVSSGAIAAGMRPLGLTRRPGDLATKQAAASVGQGLLVHRYTEAFARHGVPVGQVLLTVEDVIRRAHYRNAHRTLTRLFALGAVPVVNENDTVATAEIRFGENDRLAALVAQLVQADALVLLSDVDALYDTDPRKPGARRVDSVTDWSQLDGLDLGGVGSGVGSGGMVTKVESARMATASGIPTLLTSAAQAAEALSGGPVGTLFAAVGPRRPARLLWLEHATATRGRLVLDAGAVRAVVERQASLLPAGVVGLAGDFAAGDPVELVDEAGAVVARGLVNFDASELPALLGRTTHELAAELGPAYERELVHRDDLVVLRP
ncbi:glutamate 5-kinase [Motilibacter peucedani]|uniref:Glutamate 5-kinase n=1 Tax=Motilibacter peucedani TaxID=598650 RepID=A0A420XNS5_9ACTN|nr:glutamate 5-kinase [Motilibacter peucedani]RKS73849.1 glutamate 5-kinase [Motilibacter peucedani]